MIFTPSKASVGYLTVDYLRTFRERLLPERRPIGNRRILISRQNTVHRHMENFSNLQARPKSYGFETTVPDRMSFREEIELFYDAEIVVGAHGSGLANIVFPDNMSVVDIFPTKCVISHILRI